VFAQAQFFKRAVDIAKAHKATLDGKGLKKVADFRASTEKQSEWPQGLEQLQKDVTAFSQSFPVIGFEQSAMKYNQ
jgi:hypothetical protein